VCMNLEGHWRKFALLRIIAPLIRDIFYDLIARNRYKWFGKKESCMLPTEEMKKRFLE
jgi:predicted DCC family thiol-disulfide oxidoreductase YuxK